MKRIAVWTTAAILYAWTFSSALHALPAPDAGRKPEMGAELAQVQVPFVENKGQIHNAAVRYYARTFSGTLFVDKGGALTYVLPRNDSGSVVFKEILTEKHVKPSGLTPSSIAIHNFKGRDPAAWKRNIPNYEAVSLGEIYENIDLTLRAYGNNVEKIFTVGPGGNPEHIAIKLQGITRLQTNVNGELEAITPCGSVGFSKPVAYQMVDGKKQTIEVAYTLWKDTRYGFKVGRYDRKLPLIIDPLLASTLIGSAQNDFSWSIAIDDARNVFVSSNTASPDFPTTIGAYDQTYNGGVVDVYVAKFNSTLTSLLACTFLGGADQDTVYRITTDNSGNVFLTGFTKSSDFPLTPGSYTPPARGGMDAFVAQFDNTLSTLAASALISGGNDDAGYDILIDESGNVIVGGYTKSPDFPTTTGAYDEVHNGGQDVFVAKFDNTLSSLLASTFIGGAGNDAVTGLTSDANGNILMTGQASALFPTTPGAYSRTLKGGDWDAFVSRLDSTFSTLLASTFIGGSANEYGYSVRVNASGEIYMAGELWSDDYPTTPGAYDESFNGGSMDVMISKFDSSLSTLLASTYLGGSEQDWHHHNLLIDGVGAIYVNGLTEAQDFPITADADKKIKTINGFDVFISKFDDNLSTLLYSTFFGGNAAGNGSLDMVFDPDYNIYLTGWTMCSDFPTTPGAYDGSYAGAMDVFVSKLCFYGMPHNVDCDSVPDDEDNCPQVMNPGQEDNYPPGGNNCGDACECEGNFDDDLDVDGGDAATFKADFGRGGLNRPCINEDTCNGDFTCDGNVSGSDAALFKSDFGRNSLNNPCSSCTAGDWCSYE